MSMFVRRFSVCKICFFSKLTSVDFDGFIKFFPTSGNKIWKRAYEKCQRHAQHLQLVS
jgi:hypothetical protein